MHLDKYGLPVQADGDANDQLQRVSMLATAYELNQTNGLPECTLQTCTGSLVGPLQPTPGVYTRFIGGRTDNVSADQLISVLAAHVAKNRTKQVLLMLVTCLCRFGFAQNYKDGLNEDSRTKLPDFMLLRALPLFCRSSLLLYPFTLIVDVLLVLSALASCGPVWRDGYGLTKREPGDVDDNVLVLTLAVCRKRMVTPLSWLACKLYGKLRPWNLGCNERFEVGPDGNPITYVNRFHPVYGALRHYHRAESGGNPEIAEMWKPICKEIFE